MTRLTELAIENFRGASSPLSIRFDATKPIAVIFGENGTGKTTIVDALDLIANESVGSIRDKSSTSIAAHSPTIGRKTSDIRVTAVSKAQTWKGEVKSSKVIVEPQPSPRIRILRRSNLQRFIEAKPADRYVELKHLIAVDRVEKAERALIDAANAAGNAANQFARDRAGSLDTLERIWIAEGSPGVDAISWAASQVVRDPSEISLQERLVQNIQRALQSLIDARKECDVARARRDDASVQLRSVLGEIETAKGLDAEQSVELSRVLERVDALFREQSDQTTCPVCEQPVVPNVLKEQVAKRLDGLREYRPLDDRRIASQRMVDSAIDRWETAADRLVQSATAVLAIGNGNRPDCSPIELPGHVRDDLQADDVETALDVAAIAEELVESVTAQRDVLSEMRGRSSSLTQSLSSIRSAERETARTVAMQGALKRSVEIVRAERHRFSQQLLNDVVEETNRLYERIHPNEGLAISRLELDPNRRASLNQQARFGSHDNVPPQAYFSEAHLDTLGFCFWLAVAKRDSVHQPLTVVIDDVFSSADSQHMTRIVEVMFEESRYFDQTILTTHHRNLRSRMLGLRGASNKVHLVDLKSFWSVERGIECQITDVSVSDLRRAISPASFDRQQAASRAGIQLERVLDALALRYQLPMPRNRSSAYTLGSLFDAVGSRLSKKLVIVSTTYPEGTGIEEVFLKIRTCEYIRNQVGAHHNEEGEEISDGTVLEFARLTLDLIETVTCRHCGQLPGKDDGIQYRCTCDDPDRTYMRPLRL